ncbi:hypothetical protein GCM10010517_54920 [Streptosporangium fragile]|uniref:HTH merR-type domain-containing protein n=1 Tax=Streptosporangium fragile TaxID=46186 RepID=A0ABP6IJK5_9ACTN
MEWTIGELVERASAALAPTAQLNGRVRDVPNERLIRWYSTIGLLDPPLARRGRVALYGRRHLLQLIAVKRRQADGRTIAEIQAELAGATDRLLESIAGLPALATGPIPTGPIPIGPIPVGPPNTTDPIGPARASGPAGSGDTIGASDVADPVHPPGASVAEPTEPAAPAPPAGVAEALASTAAGAPRARFWTEAPATSIAPITPATPVASTGPVPPAPAGTPPGAPAAVLVHGVRLAAGVTLMLDGGRPPAPDDLAEIVAASEALLTLLRERGLTPPEGKHPC